MIWSKFLVHYCSK